MNMRILVLSVCVAALASRVQAIDWLHAPSKYTHDPQSGQRVAQYAPIEPVYVQARPDYLKSGIRFSRSTLRGASGSAEHLHTVETWGRPVRPYGEWKYPYRPYSVPYQYWGPPYGGLGGAYGYGATPYGAGGVGYGAAYAPANRGVAAGRRADVVGAGGGHARRHERDDFWIRDPKAYENLNPRLLRRKHSHPSPEHPHSGIDAGGASGGT